MTAPAAVTRPADAARPARRTIHSSPASQDSASFGRPSGLPLPRIAPSLGFLERHGVVGQAVTDGDAPRHEDALRIGATGHGEECAPTLVS